MAQSMATKTSKESSLERSPRSSSVHPGFSGWSGAEAEVLGLQQHVGNQAVSQLLQASQAIAPDAGGIPAIVRSVINSDRGRPLEPAVQAEMESRFQQDFSQVRIHTDSKAMESAQAVNANAYTVKQDIAFDVGQYAPESKTGKHLLAHELAHVVQQSRGGAAPSHSPNNSLEQSANQAASAVTQGGTLVQVSGASAPGLARQENNEENLSYKEKLRRRLAGAYQTVKRVAPPSVQQYVLEPLREPAKQLIQSVPEEKLKKIEQAVEPVLKTVEVLGQAIPPQAPQTGSSSVDPNKVVWLGKPPLSEQLRRRAAYQQQLAKDQQDNPLAIGSTPLQNPRPSAEDILGMSFAEMTKPDPPPTEFEHRLQSKQPFKHNILQALPPQPDVPLGNIEGLPADPNFDWSQVYWLGTALKLVPNQAKHELTLSADNVMPIRDHKTHELKGYRIRAGETIIELDRNGNVLQTTGIEAPLETPAIDPIDVALLAADVGPLVAKGLAGVGKRFFSSAAKRGLRTLRAGTARVMMGTGEALPFLERGAAGATHFERPAISLVSDVGSRAGTKGALSDVAKIGAEGASKSTVKTEVSAALPFLKKGTASATRFERPAISLVSDVGSRAGTKGALSDVAKIGAEGASKSTVKTEVGSEAIDLLNAEQNNLKRQDIVAANDNAIPLSEPVSNVVDLQTVREARQVQVTEQGEGLSVRGEAPIRTGIPHPGRRNQFLTERGRLRARMIEGDLSPHWANKPADWNAHHIIPWEFRKHPAFDILRANGGWDHNDVQKNAIALPTRRGIPGAEDLPIHQGKTQALKGHGVYNWQIKQRLDELVERFERDPTRLREEVERFIREQRSGMTSGKLGGRILF
ncbi:MAG: DUF4157 domain-containing protein [Elainella sp. Prado103]|nr:DUF4157 domain-containing protein [Elainella sp. Prado103]